MSSEGMYADKDEERNLRYAVGESIQDFAISNAIQIILGGIF